MNALPAQRCIHCDCVTGSLDSFCVSYVETLLDSIDFSKMASVKKIAAISADSFLGAPEKCNQ